MIPAEAVEAAAKALHARECGFKDWNFFHPGRGMYEEIVRPILEAAAQHMGEMEWAVFRASDGEDGTPVEGFRYPSREAAQKSINSGYTQPQFWEPRGRVVGKWTADAV